MKRIEWPGVVQCLHCKEVLVSNYVHEFVSCRCINQAFVDGGKAYLRYGGLDMTKVQVLKLSKALNKRNKGNRK